MAHPWPRRILGVSLSALALCAATSIGGQQGAAPAPDAMVWAVLHLRPIGLPGEPVTYGTSIPAAFPTELIPAGGSVTAVATGPSATVAAVVLPADLDLGKWSHEPPAGWTLETMETPFVREAPVTVLPWKMCRGQDEASFEVKTFARNPRYVRIELAPIPNRPCSNGGATFAGAPIPLLMLSPSVVVPSFGQNWQRSATELTEFTAVIEGAVRPVETFAKSLVQQMIDQGWTVDTAADAESPSSATTFHKGGAAGSTVTATLTLTARDGVAIVDAKLKLISDLPVVVDRQFTRTPGAAPPAPRLSEDSTLVLHAGRPVDHATTSVFAFLSGPFGFFSVPPPRWRAVAGTDIVVPTTYGGQTARSLRAIVYVPGFELARVELPTLTTPTTESALSLKPLASRPIRGSVNLSPALTDATIRVSYSLARLVTKLLYGPETSQPGGPAMVGALELSTGILQPDGSFAMEVPDLVNDPEFADLQTLTRQRFLENPVVAGSMPREMLNFSVCGSQGTQRTCTSVIPAVPVLPNYPSEIRLSSVR
jgi:hypothetical protein